MNTIKILSIGNSFSQDAHAYLHQILESVGISNLCYDLIVGGCSLERHCNNIKNNTKEYILEINAIGAKSLVTVEDSALLYDWDVITFQQASRMTGEPESFEPFLPDLLSYFKEKSPTAKQFLHQTWAYESDTQIAWFDRYNKDQAKMFNAIIETFGFYSDKYALPIIHAGEIIQELRKNKVFDKSLGGTALTRDGFHLNIPYGRYAVGLTWANEICNVDPEDVAFIPEGADRNICTLIKRSVKNYLK